MRGIDELEERVRVLESKLQELTNDLFGTRAGEAPNPLIATGANSAFGCWAGRNLSEQSAHNTLLGFYSGVDVVTGKRNVTLGSCAEITDSDAYGRIAIGAGARATIDHGLFLPKTLAPVKSCLANLYIDLETGQVGPAE